MKVQNLVSNIYPMSNVKYDEPLNIFCLLKMLVFSFYFSSNTAKESIFYSYTRHINGFAATLEEEVAAEIASQNILL